VKLNEFAKATGVVVVNGFRIPKRLHYWAGEEEKEQVLKHFVCVKCVVCVWCVYYLLCTMACSTLVVLSDSGEPVEF